MPTLENLTPTEVARALADHSIVLIDVREPSEYAAERIGGALLYPLSTFDPLALPDPGGRAIVFHCGVGARSARAMAIAADAGVIAAGHLAGGLMAWKAAGLPLICATP